MTANSHEIHSEVNSQFLSAYPHYVLPRVKLNENVELSDFAFEESFPYSCSLPVPITPNSRLVQALAMQREDPALTLVKEKLQWNYDVKLHTDYFIKAKKAQHLQKLLKDAKKSKTASVQPREAEFVKLFANNPDEHFDGLYNWYYTGGCISKLELNGTTVVVVPQGKKMDQVCTLSLKSDKEWQLEPNISAVATPSPNSSIFELCCKNVNGKGVIGVRVRNGCCIYSMSSLRRIELLHRTISSYPFVSLDINKHLEGRYCTVNTEREINVWDAEKDSQIFTMTVPMPRKNFPDKWNCIRWSNSRCLVMADRYYIQMMDVRKKDVIDLFSPRKKPHLLHECEMISLICPSAASSTAMYITTSHQVLLYDTRNTSKPLQQWAHLLRAPPLYGTTVSIENGKEAACFVNQQLGEINMILNSWNEELPFIEQPVVTLPNMKAALRAAHKHKLWLDPAIQQRVKLSWTGVTWLPPHKSKLTLLTVNSVGDLFSQVLKLKKEDQGDLNEEYCESVSDGTVIHNYSAKALKCLKNWEKHSLKGKRCFSVKATRRVKMKHVFKSLKNSSFILSKSEVCDTPDETDSQWKISKAEMLSYKDVMAPALLQTWEIDDEAEWHTGKVKSTEAVPENAQTAAQKVEAWLSMSLQNSSDLAKNSNIPTSTVRRKSDRTVTPHTVEAPVINEYTHSFSEVQSEAISQHLHVDSKYTPMSYSLSSNYKTPDVCSRIFAPSVPCAKHNMLSQDMFSSQLNSSQLTLSQNSVLSTSKSRTVTKGKHISGF